MSLYNCKSDGDQHRISKFSIDLEVEASYLTNGSECDCPVGHRQVCRHRIMLPRFIAKNATAGQWFHNYEQQQWIRAASDDEPNTLGDLASAASEVIGPNECTEDWARHTAEIEPVTTDDNYGTGPMMEAIYDLRADQAKDITPRPINLLELAKPNKPLELSGFPWNCYDQGKCESAPDCIMYGCAKGNGHPPRQSTVPTIEAGGCGVVGRLPDIAEWTDEPAKSAEPKPLRRL